MGETYYRIIRQYSKKGVHFLEFEFSDESDGFFLPVTIEADSPEEIDSKLNDFIGDNAKQIK